MSSLQTIEAIKEHALYAACEDDFAGYDPFDGLNSRLLNIIPSARKGVLGLGWTQLIKRSPINLRPLLAVPKGRNPKGIGLFILGLLQDYERSQDQQYLDEAIKLGDWLLAQQGDKAKWNHACWGYHFDWNARAFFVPKGKPNIITTVYVSMALYELGKATQDSRYTNAALSSGSFIVDTLLTTTEGRTFFAYIPGEETFVHNASLWGAAWVGFVGHHSGNAYYVALALEVARLSVKEQSADGSWVYGARHHHQFIDGFHTGYNLEALHFLRCVLDVDEFDEAIENGLVYYKKELFEADGTAKYYHNNRYPLDMHSVAQAVITFVKVGGTEGDFQLAEKIIDRAVDTLYMEDKKHFLYQKHKYFSNKINYIRWTQAWVYYSFALFNRMKKDRLDQ